MKWGLALLLAGCGPVAWSADAGCGGPFERGCAVAADCALLPHQVDCCGSQVVLGISASGLASAQQREMTCVAAGPFCKCLAKETVAEDGKTFPDAAALKLRCTGGRCESFVP